MMKSLLLGGLAAAAFIPSLASAQESCEQARHDNRVAGTIVGAGLGAILGGAVTGRGGGAVVGGVGGAVVGNAVAGSGTHCGENRYGYYDANGRWVPRTYTAAGYYGPDGAWVAAPPAGYGPPPGPAYGQNGYNQGPGYGPPPAPAYGQDAAYTDRGHGHMNLRDREDRMDQYIRQAISNGTIGNREGRRDLRDLANIRRMEADYRSADGHLNDGQRADIDQRLDSLRDRLHMQNDQRSY
jgi:hypothetical protein